MYSIINANAPHIVGSIGMSSINRYNWLFANLPLINVASHTPYQQAYKGFWKMRFPGTTYCTGYFTHLQANKGNRLLEPQSICLALKPVSSSLQFSFATKMAHMANPNLPIYDLMVSQFYFLPKPPEKASYPDKLAHYMTSYNFLVQEYDRVIANRLLDPAIAAFRHQFPSAVHHSTVKVIDWLIWRFVDMATSGSFLSGVFRHT